MKFFLTLLFCLFFIIPAKAQDDRYFNSSKVYKEKKITHSYKRIKYKTYLKWQHRSKKIIQRKHHYNFVADISPAARLADAAIEAATTPLRAVILGGRPVGCPHRFCGCGLSIHLFGRIIPHLNLANNWRVYFPRTAASPGMVAVRSGHVFKLLNHVAGNTWKVWDANSGGGRIRIHNRSIAGYTIVNPSG